MERKVNENVIIEREVGSRWAQKNQRALQKVVSEPKKGNTDVKIIKLEQRFEPDFYGPGMIKRTATTVDRLKVVKGVIKK